MNKNNLNELIVSAKKILKLVYILLIVIGSYVLLKIIKELGIFKILLNLLKILTPLFIGIAIAWLLNPFVKWLENKKIRRIIGTSFAYVILVGALILLVKAIIPLIYNQTIDLVGNFPKIFSSVKDWLENIFSNINSSSIDFKNIEDNLLDKLDVFSKDLSTSLPLVIINFLSSTITYIGTFVIGLVIGFFLLLSCDNLGNTLLEMTPKNLRKSIKELSDRINQSLRSYINGTLIDAGVVFLISTIAFLILGLKAPLLFGLFCGLTNVIPYVGPYIGGAPAVIVAFSQGTGVGIAVLIAIVIIQAVEGNFLQTLIISKTTKLNPVTIIIGLLIFGYFFGIVGMLLSTPIIGVCKVIIQYFDEKYDLLNFN